LPSKALFTCVYIVALKAVLTEVDTELAQAVDVMTKENYHSVISFVFLCGVFRKKNGLLKGENRLLNWI